MLYLLSLVTILAANEVPCPALRANADLLYDQGRLAEAAGAYRAYLMRCSSPEVSRTVPSGSTAELVAPGPGIVEPKPKPFAKAAGGKTAEHATLMVLVSENGKVLDTRVLRSSGTVAGDRAAEATIKAAQFEPATKNGVPVQMWTALSVPSSQ